MHHRRNRHRVRAIVLEEELFRENKTLLADMSRGNGIAIGYNYNNGLRRKYLPRNTELSGDIFEDKYPFGVKYYKGL